MTLELSLIQTPVGPMALYAHAERLVALALDGSHGSEQRHEQFLTRHLGEFTTTRVPDAAGAATRLKRYFAGELAILDQQPLQILGTEFQQRCWKKLRGITAGHTTSYAGLAAKIGQPTAVRAVAAANGANILPLFIPCHRVIAANGALWGYGGGLPMKQWLLRHEGAHFTPLTEQESLAL